MIETTKKEGEKEEEGEWNVGERVIELLSHCKILMNQNNETKKTKATWIHSVYDQFKNKTRQCAEKREEIIEYLESIINLHKENYYKRLAKICLSFIYSECLPTNSGRSEKVLVQEGQRNCARLLNEVVNERETKEEEEKNEFKENGFIYFLRGRAEEDINKAFEYYQEAAKRAKNFCCTFNNMAMIYEIFYRNLEKALHYYSKSIKLDPLYYIMYRNRGTVYATLNEYKKALLDHTTAIKLKPDEALSYQRRAEVYTKLKKIDLALADHEKALKIEPNNFRVYIQRAKFYIKINNFNKAKRDMDTAIQKFPYEPGLYELRADILSHRDNKNKNLDEAEEDYSEAINKCEQENAGTYHRIRGYFYFYIKMDIEKALADYNSAIHIDPTYHHGYYSRSLVYEALGQFERALDDLMKAVKLDAKEPMIFFQMGCLLSDRFELYNEAIQCFEHVNYLEPNYRGLMFRIKLTQQFIRKRVCFGNL